MDNINKTAHDDDDWMAKGAVIDGHSLGTTGNEELILLREVKSVPAVVSAINEVQMNGIQYLFH